MTRILSACVTTVLTVATSLPAGPAPNIHGETVRQVAERTGYTPEQIRESFPPIRDWKQHDPEPLPGRMAESFAKDGFGPPPAPGVHPRMGYRGPWVGGWINALADGRVPEDLADLWTDDDPRSKRHYLMHLLPYESFRCLIDEDAAAGRRIASAAATLARDLRKHMDTWTGTHDWQRIYQTLGSHSLGLTYDWACTWMTDAQRAAVRRTIADITRGKRYLGLDQVPAFPANTSNWNIILEPADPDDWTAVNVWQLQFARTDEQVRGCLLSSLSVDGRGSR